MSFKSIADKAIEYFDDHTWNVFKACGQELLKKVKKYGANSETSLAHARVLIAMIGQAYGATRFKVRPWSDDKDLYKISKALVGQIQRMRPSIKMHLIMESLEKSFKYKKIEHYSWPSKVGHVLWPQICPIYDSRATYSLGKIGKFLSNEVPHSILGWRDCSWEEYINSMHTVLNTFRNYYDKISDFHELDKVLWYYGSKDEIEPLSKEIRRINR